MTAPFNEVALLQGAALAHGTAGYSSSEAALASSVSAEATLKQVKATVSLATIVAVPAFITEARGRAGGKDPDHTQLTDPLEQAATYQVQALAPGATIRVAAPRSTTGRITDNELFKD